VKKYIYSLAVVVALVGLSGCSMSSINPFSGDDSDYSSGIAGIDSTYSKYKTLESNKAMAVAIGADKRYAVGYAFEYKSQEKANAEALKRCEASNSKAKIKVDTACKLFAVGDKVVYK